MDKCIERTIWPFSQIKGNFWKYLEIYWSSGQRRENVGAFGAHINNDFVVFTSLSNDAAFHSPEYLINDFSNKAAMKKKLLLFIKILKNGVYMYFVI